MKICKDGRIWGQNNKEAEGHLGIFSDKSFKKYMYIIKPKLKNTPIIKIKKVSWNKGSVHPNWKGGISKTKEWKTERNRIWRKNNPEKAKYYIKLSKHKRRAIGYINKKIIQMVYEDNIKKYGTLTCIYCLNQISFGKDTLEHKHPIAKGGTNDYENLAIACLNCNMKKNDKTYEQFIKEREVKNGNG